MESYEEFCSRLRAEHGDVVRQQASLQCTMSSIQFYGRPILTPRLNEDQFRAMTWYRHHISQKEAAKGNKKTLPYPCLTKSQDRGIPLSHVDQDPWPKQANVQSQGCRLSKDEESSHLLAEVQKEGTLLARIQDILDSVQLPGVLEDPDGEPCSHLPSSSLQEQLEACLWTRRRRQPPPGSVDKTEEAVEAEEGCFSDTVSKVQQNQPQMEKQPQGSSDEKNNAESPHNSQSQGAAHRDYSAYTHFSTPPSSPASDTFSAFNSSPSHFTLEGNAASFSSPSHNSAESRHSVESQFPDSCLGSMPPSLTGSYARLPSPKASLNPTLGLLPRCGASSDPGSTSHLPSPHTSLSSNRMSTLCSLSSPIQPQPSQPYSTPTPYSSTNILISCPVSAAELSPLSKQKEDLLVRPTRPSFPTPVVATPPQCPLMSSPPRVSWHYSSYASPSTAAPDQQGSLDSYPSCLKSSLSLWVLSSPAPGPRPPLHSLDGTSGALSKPQGELPPAPLEQYTESSPALGPCPSCPARGVLNRSYDVESPVLSWLRPHVTTERPSEDSHGHSSPAVSSSSQTHLASRHVAPELSSECQAFPDPSPDRERSWRGVGDTGSSLTSRETFPCNSRVPDPSQLIAAEDLQCQISILEEMRRCLEEQHSLQLSLLLSQQQRELQRLTQVANPKLQKSLCRLGAVAKGFLTRRLLQTEKVKNLRKTVQDTREFISSIQDRGHLSPQDCTLRERVSAQLQGALYDVHEVFYVLPVAERLLLIQQDRELRAERKLRDMDKSRSPGCGRVTLSAATQKSLERKRQRMKETLRRGKPTNHQTKNPSTDRILQPNQDENAQAVSSRLNPASASDKEERRKRKVIQRKQNKYLV